MAKKIQDGNQIVTNVDSNDNLTFSIKNSFIDSTPTVNSTNLVTSGGVKSALDINTTDIAAAVIRIANNETNISNNTDDIEALEDAVSTNTTNISTNTTDIDNLETTVGTLSTNVNTNTTNIGTLSNLTTTSKTNLVSAINEVNTGDNISERLVSIGSLAPETNEKVWFKTTSGAEGLYVNEELWYSMPKILWANLNPTSTFANQDVTLNEAITNYLYYEIIFKTFKDEGIAYNTGRIPTSMGTNLTATMNASDGGVRSRVRPVTISSATKIHFGSCVLINTKDDSYSSSDNERLIPYQIIGYKI